MNADNFDKNNVKQPAYYWKAFCYTEGQTAYSWVYVQVNENDQYQSDGDLFMTAQQFSQGLIL